MDQDRFINVLDANDGDGNIRPGTVFARPFRTYNMASAIWMKRGLDTGMTAHGHHDFQLSDDTLRKVHIGHYTFWHKSVVKTPKNVFIAEDIFARGYTGGEGADKMVLGAEGLQGIIEGSKSPGEVGSIIVLGQKDDLERKPADENGPEIIKPLANPIDISGEYSVDAFKDGPSGLDVSGGGINGSIRGDVSRQLNRLRGGQNQSVNPFNSPLRRLNTLCYRGMSIAVAGDKRQVTLSTDHWGPNVYQGVRAARTGAMAFIKDMDYERGDFSKLPLA